MKICQFLVLIGRELLSDTGHSHLMHLDFEVFPSNHAGDFLVPLPVEGQDQRPIFMSQGHKDGP